MKNHVRKSRIRAEQKKITRKTMTKMTKLRPKAEVFQETRNIEMVRLSSERHNKRAGVRAVTANVTKVPSLLRARD